MAGQSALVVSAHAADFVWRAGGAIALHAAKGHAVTIVCLSFGERGESAKLWKQPGVTLQSVKDARRKEAEAAATAANSPKGGESGGGGGLLGLAGYGSSDDSD